MSVCLDPDIEELACRVLGKNEQEAEAIIADGGIDDLLYERYEICFETYSKIVADLLPFTPPVSTALGGDQYHAFVDGNTMIVRVKKGDGTPVSRTRKKPTTWSMR